MKLVLNKKSYELSVCRSFLSRLRGNMFRRNVKCLVFPKCSSIHTFFMFRSIDVILFDKDKKVLKEVRNLKPFRIIIIKNAYYVVELEVNTLKEKNVIYLK